MPIQASVTVWLISEARGGPFIFWDDLDAAMQNAARLGFAAIELFPPEPETFEPLALKAKLASHGLALSAVGSGGGFVRHKLTLTNPDAAHRQQATAYIKKAISFAGQVGAPIIIGSMQGRWGESVSREQALGFLAETLNELGEHASQYGQPVLYEPLNRYETNLLNTIADGVKFVESLKTRNVKLLADLFHMHIEETNLAEAIRAGGKHIAHIHFADSNRRPAGMGHMNYAPIVEAIHQIGYSGYLAAEAFPYPDPVAAAAQTIKKFRELFPQAK